MSSASDPPAGPDPDPGVVPACRPVTDPPPASPPRSAMTMRDMLAALLVLVVVVLVVAGGSRACSFAPAGPTIDPSRLPVVDAPAELRALAPAVPFGLRIPAVAPGWKANSVGQDRVGETAARVVRTGYLTPEGRYLRLLQSDAPEEALLAVETGTRAVAAQGPQDVGGQRWVIYGDRGTPPASGRPQPIWVADVATPGPAPVRLLITGSGSDEEFRTLAAAASAGELV